MNPKLLQQLATVIKYGSMSAAAERLHVTQPTLTRSIQVIEQRAGAPVLTRTSKGVEATEIGLRLARLGENIDHYANLTNSVIEQWQAGLDTEIRLGIGPLLGMGPMKGFIEQYGKRNKILHFVTSTSATLIRQLNRGELDLVITPINIDTQQSDLIRRAIFKDETRIFVGKKSPFYGQQRVISNAELKQQTWIASGVSAGFTDHMDSTQFTTPAQLVFTGSIDLVVDQLKHTDVAVVLPYRMTILGTDLSKDHIINTDLAFPRRDIALWIPRSKLERPDVMEIADQLEAYFLNLDEHSLALP